MYRSSHTRGPTTGGLERARAFIGGLLRPPLKTGWLTGILLLIGLGVYWPVFGFSFFGEDPHDMGQVRHFGYWQLLTTPASGAYYRPLTLILTKLLKTPGPGFSPWPYYVLGIGGRLASTILLYGVARRWLKNEWAAFASAVLFVLHPLGFEAMARTSSLHSIIVALVLGTLWLYTAGRESGKRRWILVGLLFSSIAPLLHENGLVLPALILLLELYLVGSRRVERFDRFALVFLAPALIFVAIWLAIPKPVLPAEVGVRPLGLLYMLQGLDYPLARLISQTGGWGLSPVWQAGTALLLSSIILAAAYGKKRWPELLLLLALGFIASSPAGLSLSLEYLLLGGRVFYFPAFNFALAWGGTVGQAGLRRAIGVLLTAAIAAQSLSTLQRQIALYQAGVDVMEAGVGVERQGSRLLFVNFPDRYEYRQPLYPLGFWGMLIAPVSQDMADFGQLSDGVDLETESLSDFPLLVGVVDASPYRVNTRGVDAHASELLYEKILWADATYFTQYHSDGKITLEWVGDVRATPTTNARLGRFGDVSELRQVEADPAEGKLRLTLYWVALQSARLTDTVFVHVFDAHGALVGQGDGESLGGLLPPSAWRVGQEVADRRLIVTDGLLPPGAYRLTVGLYDRSSGNRYPAYDSAGREVPEGELEVARVVMP